MSDASEGLRAATAMISHEGKIIWDSFRSLLAANAVIAGLAGAALKLANPALAPLTPILALLGLLVCLAWALVTTRAFEYYRYWFAWARKYEKDTQVSEAHMFQLGKKYGDGESVRVGELDLRMNWSGRLFRIKYLMVVVNIAFGIVYIFLIRAA